MSGVVAVGGNEIPVEAPFTALPAPPGPAALVGAAVDTAVCVLLGPAINMLLGRYDGSGVATTNGAAERSAVGVAVRSRVGNSVNKTVGGEEGVCALKGSTNGVSVATSIACHVVGTPVTSGSSLFVVATAFTDNTVAAKPPT
jgi:hypothetical protein